VPPVEIAEDRYRQAERRIEYLTLLLGIVAAGIALFAWGARFAGGIALGAAISWLNFRWLKGGISALATLTIGVNQRVPRIVYVKFLGGFVLLLAVIYVILSRPIVPGSAVLAGLFTTVAAVLFEMVYQLVRGAD
jgi:hypothetical protein